jgi:hypothetical protein
MQIQPRDLIGWRQHSTQLKLCVPQVSLKSDSYRLKNRDLGRVLAAAPTGD